MSLYAKSIAALLTGIATWGITAAPDGISVTEMFGLLAVIGTAVAVFAVPNQVDDPEAVQDEGLTLVELLVGGIVLIVLFSLIVGYR